jgi:hypothetical protein
MTGSRSEVVAAGRGSFKVLGVEAGGAAVGRGGSGETGVGAAGCAVEVADAGKRVAPHMPQKRFVPGFSLPQRGQRTISPVYRLR